MQEERRCYSRLKTEINCVCYDDENEFDIVIDEMCENGIRLLLSKKQFDLMKIEKNKKMQIQFVDTYTIFRKDKTYIGVLDIVVIHFNKLPNGLYRVGCKCENILNNYDKYVSDKKIVSFLEGMEECRNEKIHLM